MKEDTKINTTLMGENYGRKQSQYKYNFALGFIIKC